MVTAGAAASDWAGLAAFITAIVGGLSGLAALIFGARRAKSTETAQLWNDVWQANKDMTEQHRRDMEELRAEVKDCKEREARMSERFTLAEEEIERWKVILRKVWAKHRGVPEHEVTEAELRSL